MDRSGRWQVVWRLVAVLPPVLAAFFIYLANDGRRPKGFVFTPLWSALFAAWFLTVVTLLLHWLVRRQLEPQASDRAADEEPMTEARMREVADHIANRVRDADGEPAESPEVVEAGRSVVDVARTQLAAQVQERRAGLKSLIVGADGRASTSKVQAVLWTYAVLFVFSYMLVLGRVPFDRQNRPRIGLDNAFAEFVAAQLQPEYIALLGLPVGAAIAAKALTTSKVATGQLSKAPGGKSGVAAAVSELVSNDAGQSDLLDFQYFVFNVLTLIYFFVAFAASADTPSDGLPDIPPTLLTLAGVSTTSYVVKKALEGGVAPSITSVAPLRVQLGRDRELVIVGSGFLRGRATDSARRAGVATKSSSELNQVLLDGRPLVARKWSDTRVTATLPLVSATRDVLLAEGWRDNPKAELVVRDDVGVGSPAVTIAIALPGTSPPPDTEEDGEAEEPAMAAVAADMGDNGGATPDTSDIRDGADAGASSDAVEVELADAGSSVDAQELAIAGGPTDPQNTGGSSASETSGARTDNPRESKAEANG